MAQMEKEYILLLDTATEVCSVALGRMDGTIIAHKEEATPNRHSEMLAPFVDELLLNASDPDIRKRLCGVVVSEGPGSYTGLRIGASYAKGLCWALGIPLISCTTTEALARAFLEREKQDGESDYLLLPMIDARRMEVYLAFYDPASIERNGREADVRALILTEEEGRDYLRSEVKDSKVVFFGSGAEKAVPVMESLFGERAVFVPGITAHAGSMLPVGIKAIREGRGEDVGYWTPFYLKEFQAMTPRRKF